MYLLRIFCDEDKREQILKDSPKPRIWLNHPSKRWQSCGLWRRSLVWLSCGARAGVDIQRVAGIAVMFFGLTLKAWATYKLKHR